MEKATSKPIIVVDIDDVLGDQTGAILRYLSEQKGIKISPEQYSETWDEMLGVSGEQAIAFFKEFALSSYGYGNFEIIPGGGA